MCIEASRSSSELSCARSKQKSVLLFASRVHAYMAEHTYFNYNCHITIGNMATGTPSNTEILITNLNTTYV